MLGPLKFGLQQPVSAVKAAGDPARFALNLSFLGSGAIFNPITLKGPPGSTAALTSIHRQNGPQTVTITIPSSGIVNATNIISYSSSATFSGSNSITEMYMRLYYENYSITGITGTYPTALKVLQIGFNSADPIFTPPTNLEALLFAGKPGPSSLTTGSNLTRLDFPPNLISLDTSVSTKLTVLPPLPTGLTSLTTPPAITGLTGVVPNLTTLDISRSTKLTTLSIPGAKISTLTVPPTCTTLNVSGCTGLTSLTVPPTCTTLNVSGCTGLTSLTVPPKITTLNISKCTGLTTVSFPPVLTTLRIDGSGLTTLDLSRSNITTLNMPPSMDAQLKTVEFGSKLKPSGLFRFEIPEDGNWNLY